MLFRSITLEDVAKQDEIIKKAKAGELVEKAEIEKGENTRVFNVFVEGESFEVGVEEVGGAPVITYAAPATATPAPAPSAPVAPAPKAAAPAPKAEAKPEPNPAPKAAPAPAAAAGDGTPVKAPMPGMIIKYEKNVGDSVDQGETIVIIEAMKMENALPAPAAGTVTAVHFSSGDSVAKDDVLVTIG